jgi:4-cresol dehydrogenase (hydroxylating)
MSIRTGSLQDEFNQAIAEWTSLLGAVWVERSALSIARLEAATFETSGHTLAHISPATVQELSACLRIASRHRIPVNVFSRGKSYGYSSCAPSAGTTATIDLSRLNGITEFDEELGYVRVEPGVTFLQLNAFLEARGSRRFLPATGGPADGSVLANTVERGHGLGYGGDRYGHSCRYQIVTSDGQCFETGFGRFEGSRVANLMRTGVGPSLDGLFTQSSYGVVTAITLWLPRKPRYHATVLVLTPSRNRVGALFDCTAEALRQGLLRDGSTFAMGEYKLASILARREEYGPTGKVLGWNELRHHRRRWGNGAWLLAATLEADTPALLSAKVAATRAIFSLAREKGERLLLLTSRRVRLVRALLPLLPAPLANVLRQILDVFYEHTPLLGHPIEQPLRTAYWAVPKSRSASGQDLHADAVGLLWVSVPVPLRGQDIATVTTTIDDGLLEHGFEPATQVTVVSERVARVITALMYDRTEPNQDQHAIACQNAVYATLRSLGYYTYRLQPHLMTEYAGYGDVHQSVVGRIKKALDPANVLDPSRYPGLPLTREADASTA